MKKLTATLLFPLILFLSACSQNSTTGDPFAGLKLATVSGNTNYATAVPTAVQTLGKLPLSEDFSQDDGMWVLEDDEYGKAAFEGGSFIIEARQEAQTMWSTYAATFGDVKIDADVKALNSDENDNNGFGVDCRIQENGDGYSFQISSDGYFAILKFVDTDGSRLVDWTQSDIIYPGVFSNHITAICKGSHLEMWVNGQWVASIEDSDFPTGMISLSASTYTEMPTTVSFDNLQVTSPN